MTEHDEESEHEREQGNALMRSLHGALEGRYGPELDEGKLTAVLAGICEACPDQDLIERIRREKPGVNLYPKPDGWIYVGVEGIESPTSVTYFGRFTPSMILRDKPARPQG